MQALSKENIMNFELFKKFLGILVLGLSVNGYTEGYFINDQSVDQLMKQGYPLITIDSDRETLEEQNKRVGLIISSNNKKIETLRISEGDKPWSEKDFNKLVFNHFIGISDQSSQNIINITPDFHFSYLLFAEPAEEDPFKKYRTRYNDVYGGYKLSPPSITQKFIDPFIEPKVDKSSQVNPNNLLIGNQTWINKLVICDGDMYLYGTKFHLDKAYFGFADKLVFEAPTHIQTDIRQIIFTKMKNTHYLCVTGEIDFSSPNILAKLRSNFYVIGAKDVKFVFDPKKVNPIEQKSEQESIPADFKPIRVILENGMVIERVTANSVQFGNSYFSYGSGIFLNGMNVDNFFIKKFYLQKNATQEQFLDEIQNGIGAIKEIIPL